LFSEVALGKISFDLSTETVNLKEFRKLRFVSLLDTINTLCTSEMRKERRKENRLPYLRQEGQATIMVFTAELTQE
jgi:hypothetical protein